MAYNIVLEDKERIIDDANEIIELLTNTEALDNQIQELNAELIVIAELVEKLVKTNSKTISSTDDYNKKYEELNRRYEDTKSTLDNLNNEKTKKEGQALKMKSFMSRLQEFSEPLQNWNEHVWRLLVEGAKVHSDKTITYKFKDGSETTI